MRSSSGLLCALLLPLSVSAQSLDLLGPQAPLFREALALAQLTEAECTFDAEEMHLWGGDAYRLPIFDDLHRNPWKISPHWRSLSDELLARSADLNYLLYTVESYTGHQVGNAVGADPLPPYRARVTALRDTALAVALSELDGQPVEYFQGLADYRLIPRPARDAAALLIFLAADAIRAREAALAAPLLEAGLDPREVWGLMLHALDWREEEASFEELERARRIEMILDRVDFPRLYAGANLLLAGIASASASLQAAQSRMDPGDFLFAARTRYGWVKISGAGRHHHREDEQHLLVLDLGGDDTYASAANTLDFAHPLSIVVDLAGNDLYRSELEDQPAFGAGVCGYGFLVDLSGDDVYAGVNAGQGCGILGVGLLYDAAGNDHYQGDSGVQGSGTFGVGILADLDGDDEYRCFRAAQGYGYTLGGGLLIDAAGSDRYVADDQDIKYAWSQGYAHQSNMAQGFGFGRRADYIDGHSWAGGIGMLVDGAGDDQYSCGVYGLGCGYWYGLGLFADKSGNDEYTSYAYSLASPPDFAIGVVQDDAGDDLYRSGGSRACGVGRDFSIGWFEEGAGNDRYYCNDTAFGVGNVNGLGIFWDKGGDDVYVACDHSFGMCTVESEGSLRDEILNVGLFIDGAGMDRYYQLPESERERVPFDFADPTVFPEIYALGNGRRLSRYDDLPQPGATGAALDAE